MKNLQSQYSDLFWYSILFISITTYPNAAYAIIPEIIDKIVSDINIWVFVAAGLLSIIALVFKSTRTKIFAYLSAAFAIYMFYTIIVIAMSTHFYK
jgi:hypothetical protein